MSDMSFYIAATSLADARALFEKCAEMAATGTKIDGRLVRSPLEGGGCAQLFVWPEEAA